METSEETSIATMQQDIPQCFIILTITVKLTRHTIDIDDAFNLVAKTASV